METRDSNGYVLCKLKHLVGVEIYKRSSTGRSHNCNVSGSCREGAKGQTRKGNLALSERVLCKGEGEGEGEGEGRQMPARERSETSQPVV